MSESLIFFNLQKKYRKRTKKYISSQTFLSELLFFCERKTNLLKKKERFAHLLIYHERPERIAHSHSFVMSELSDSLTVAHLS